MPDAEALSLIADQHVLGHGVLGITRQRVDDLIHTHPGGAGIPDREWGDAVSVDVFGRLYEFGETRQFVPALRVPGIVYLQQNRVIPLDDERRGGGLRAGTPGP